MLPGLVAGYYTSDECHLDLSVVCTFASAVLIHAEAEGIDKEVRLAQLAAGLTIIGEEVHWILGTWTLFGQVSTVAHIPQCPIMQANLVMLKGRPPIPFDVLSVDIGIVPSRAVPGSSSLATPVKPISG